MAPAAHAPRGPVPASIDAMPMKVKISAASPLWRTVGLDTTSRRDTDNTEPASDTSSSRALESTPLAPAPTPLHGQASPFLPTGSPAGAAGQPTHERLSKKPTRRRGAAKKPPALEAKTTVMIRNLPFDQTCDTLIDLMDCMGFAGRFDFVYVPMNLGKMRSVGYGFANLISHAVANQFMSVFEGFMGWASELNAEACEVCWSCCDGLDANIKRNQHSPIMADSLPAVCKPVLLKDGMRVPFPEPVKTLRGIRGRKSFKTQESSD